MLIAVDFDGTIVEHKYPKIGKEIPFATETLKRLVKDGHRLILWTVRSGNNLQEAVKWCEERGVVFWAVNKDYESDEGNGASGSPKVKADIYIDDRNLGGLPDWGVIYDMITNDLTYQDLGDGYTPSGTTTKKKKRKWF